jgi:hypothetical protein
MDDLPSDQSKKNLDAADVFLRYGEIVPIQHDEVGKFTALQRSQEILPQHVLSRPVGGHLEREHSIDSLFAGVDLTIDFPIHQDTQLVEDRTVSGNFVVIDFQYCFHARVDKASHRRYPAGILFSVVP